ncbi:glycosyltransferase family 4 protein [Aliamphritea ceti]|uniref:glycosyltransferase family 4 protein n=1 Tax=Aliamphritea ceti TaxID=1524258 RepID=UPI0021C32F99|nr:glycosyltransferase family 4 protein [Aliamphritea ceti]
MSGNSIVYISASVYPSVSANSVHVARQAAALSQKNESVELYVCSPLSTEDLLQHLCEHYGSFGKNLRLRRVWLGSVRGATLQIALYSFFCVFFEGLFRRREVKRVYTRNLYAAFLLAILGRKRVAYELHDIEKGFRGGIQKLAVCSSKAHLVAISKALKSVICDIYNVAANKVTVLHDAADIFEDYCSEEESLDLRKELFGAQTDRRFLVGYVGHLYSGRGIDVVAKLAELNPDIGFFVVGGTEKDLIVCKSTFVLPNLKFVGHVSHSRASRYTMVADCLLMPYQKNVSVGAGERDTVRWMSPMKMFEYMGSGTPFISSDLPVLREVLKDNVNCLLVSPDNIEAWNNALQELRRCEQQRFELAQNAFNQLRSEHTWDKRAGAICNVISS